MIVALPTTLDCISHLDLRKAQRPDLAPIERVQFRDTCLELGILPNARVYTEAPDHEPKRNIVLKLILLAGRVLCSGI